MNSWLIYTFGCISMDIMASRVFAFYACFCPFYSARFPVAEGLFYCRKIHKIFCVLGSEEEFNYLCP